VQRAKRDLKRSIAQLDAAKAMLPMSRSELRDLEAAVELQKAHGKQIAARLAETRHEVCFITIIVTRHRHRHRHRQRDCHRRSDSHRQHTLCARVLF
jgi:hypothetical protein